VDIPVDNPPHLCTVANLWITARVIHRVMHRLSTVVNLVWAGKTRVIHSIHNTDDDDELSL
jgi:hypothetical protein